MREDRDVQRACLVPDEDVFDPGVVYPGVNVGRGSTEVSEDELYLQEL